MLLESESESESKVLYEIAMSIGNSTDLDKALKEALTTMLRKLNGVRIAVFTMGQRAPLSVLPKRGFNSDYQGLVAQHLMRPSEDHLLLEGQLKSDFYYLFRLQQTGGLLFITRQPLNPLLLKMLLPISQKLDNSIQACMAVQQLKQKEQDLNDSLVRLQLAQKSKDRFLANMSHEIRTPLNGVLGFIQQLSDTQLSEKQSYYLDIIEKSSETLMGIINDILDFSKIESGLLEVHPHPFDFTTEIQPAIYLFTSRAHEKALNFVLEVDPKLKTTLLGDALRIKQVLTNLVSNAIKFTQQGSVQVRMRLVSQQADNMRICFEVQDSGIGIAPEKQLTIFDAFSQAEGHITRDFGGTGLGLSIAHKLVELMGGCLQVSSNLGGGSRFWFELELKQTKAEATMPTTSLEEQDFSSKKVLLVEDNTVNQLLMKAIFKKIRLDFDLAENGLQALEKIEEHNETPYDLVLMDINMPVMDGLEAMEILQQKIGLGLIQPLPVVALTANAMAGDKALYQEKGMLDTLTKPLKLEALLQVLVTQFFNQS